MGNRALCSGGMCPKATLNPAGHDNELFDDTSACDPAGTIFNETLEDLNEVDRLMLVFASSSNLAAVRWLFVLGANADACDTNGTTSLHAACRSGSLAVVQEFVNRKLPLDATDISGWTALHVALFMGRRTVAVHLMEKGADLSHRNVRGLTPSDLCSDVWLREAVTSCGAHRHCYGLDKPWKFGTDSEISEDIQISSRLRFEPFFVPRASVLKDLRDPQALQQLGVEIFNSKPGQGLAFLVSTGAVRDFPVELSTFLSDNVVSLTQVGEFLGEDFSLSQTLRLEFINSIRLMGTGVVSCLAKVFNQFHIPSDMQKIDRLLDATAQIWWRQHEQLKEKGGRFAQELRDPPRGDDMDFALSSKEVEGLRLMSALKSYDVLHQIMFSAVMLHWNLYAPLPPSQRVTPEGWLKMNLSMCEPGGESAGDVEGLKHVLSLVYNMISHTFFPQLQIWNRPPPASSPPVNGALSAATLAPQSQEGWGQLVGGGFPSFAGSTGTITYRHIRNILSETTSTAYLLTSPNMSRQMEPGQGLPLPPSSAGAGAGPSSVMPARQSAFSTPGLGGGGGLASSGANEGWMTGGAAQPSRHDWVWLASRNGLLFLSPSPNPWSPYAFLHLESVCIHSVDQVSLIITLIASGKTAPETPVEPGRPPAPGGLKCSTPEEAATGSLDMDGPHVQVIFLLPDGRWQLLDMPRLKVQFADAKQMERWRGVFASPTAAASDASGRAGGAPALAKLGGHEGDFSQNKITSAVI